jgi:hypothetical protein
MKLKVTFREYTLPSVDPDTKEEERGDYLGSFSEEIEGNTPAEILAMADTKAKQYSGENKTDVRVWETEVAITPRGIVSR